MGTSNWQNIPFCIDALMKIAPRRVLDIGVGFGRWGMITREFCDVWFQRVLPNQWAVHIEGIEGFKANIVDYHAYFYNTIHIGDARHILPTLSDNWDVVIFGDVLEHFERHEAESMLCWCLEHANYIIVNIPLGNDWPQEDMYDNPYERHLSQWGAEDFTAFSLCRQALFNDYLNRPFGSFILSKHDPKGLAQSLFSQNSAVTSPFAARLLGSVDPIEQHLLDQVRVLQTEASTLQARVHGIEQSRGFQVLNRVRKSRLGKPIRRISRFLIPEPNTIRYALVKRNPRLLAQLLRERLPRTLPPLKPSHVRVQALGRHTTFGEGNEAWLLELNADSSPVYDMHRIPVLPGWDIRSNDMTSSGVCLVSNGQGYIDIPTTPGTMLRFMTHPWSGLITIFWCGHKLTVDLYSERTGTITVRLDQSLHKPMVAR